ncbi:MAG: hypothetical protein ACKVP3_03285 [Hyphomicrobiaceae bacterium]
MLLMAWALAAFAACLVVSMIAEWREMRLLYPIFIAMPIVGIASVAVYAFAKRLIIADRGTQQLHLSPLLWPLNLTKKIPFKEIRAIISENMASYGLLFFCAYPTDELRIS